MKNLKSNLDILAKSMTYQSTMNGLSEVFAVSVLGLLLNLLINQAYPITHFFFLFALALVIVGGVVVEYTHRKRELRRSERRLTQLLAEKQS
jgi:ABC-type tungstate transport system substrate-binding protein